MMLGVFFLNIFTWNFQHIWSLASEVTVISAVDFIDEYTHDSEKLAQWPEAWGINSAEVINSEVKTSRSK